MKFVSAVFILSTALAIAGSGCAPTGKNNKLTGKQDEVPLTGTAYRYFSQNQQVYVDFIPAKGATFIGPGKGIARRTDTNEILWEVPFYTRDAVLTDDGISLIRIEPEGSDQKHLRDIAMAFYNKGQEVKRYQVHELVKDKKRLQKTINTYFWQARTSSIKTGLSPDQKTYTAVLVDGTSYTFSVSTGEILEQSRDLKARGFE